MSKVTTAAKVDFSKRTGTLRHKQHGSNSCTPLASRALIDFTQEFKEMNFWGTRTHDWALWNAGQRMIDTHFIFPLMHLDPSKPENYYFRATDDIIKLAHDCGMAVFYRLGTSIEHTGTGGADEHYNTLPPEDYEKYAEVLAGIVRHYTKGWANGFEYSDMIYWEFWNEPDLSTKAWCGTEEGFVKLFVTVLKRLKSEFPELKIGGPALCGISDWYLNLILTACEEAGVKPDFFSWHCYSANADDLIEQPRRVREKLDARGFTETETCINEWHYITSWVGVQSSATPELRSHAVEGPCGIHGIDSACFNLAVLSGWQDQPLDSGFYYGAAIDGTWGFRDEFRRLTKNFYSMKMFGQFLAENSEKVESTALHRKTYTIAAVDPEQNKGSLLITDFLGTRATIEVEVAGMEDAKSVTAMVLDNDHDLVPAQLIWRNNTLTLIKNGTGSAAFLVTFEK